MEWFALLIPALVGFILFKYFKHKAVWWEILIPTAVCFLFILAFKFTVKTVLISDTEYFGHTIVEARYYEYWETYVSKTCSKQVACGTYTTGSGKDAQTHTKYCTEYYDCSYCDRNQPYWVALDENGREFRITEDYFHKLIKKWGVGPTFVDLNRNIKFTGSCGKDGDMFVLRWQGEPERSETSVTKHTYENKIQASHSSFKLPTIEKEEATKLGLYDYPGFYDFYKQRCVLGLPEILWKDSVAKAETLFQYINGYYGPKNFVKLFVCLYYNKSSDISYKQEAYWDGGNQNEVILCIGLDKATKKIEWVRPFSWTNNKRLLVNLREDVAELKYFDSRLVYEAINKNIEGDIHRDFSKDFSYLEVDLPTWAMWVTYIITLLLSVGCAVWVIKNEVVDEVEKDRVVWNKEQSMWRLKYKI